MFFQLILLHLYINVNSIEAIMAPPFAHWDMIATTDSPQRCNDFTRRSCDRRCAASPATHSNQYFYCNCDVLCVEFGDCCHDYQEQCKPDYIRGSVTSNTSTTSCKMISKALGVYVVSACPEEKLVDNITIELCENPNHDDILGITPVMDNQTGVHYENIYCAMCNGVQNVTFWQSKVYCMNDAFPEDLDEIIISKNKLWDIVKNNDQCSINFTMSDQIQHHNIPPRSCFKLAENYQDECSRNPNATLANMCRDEGFAPVFVTSVERKEAVMFPNFPCALCANTDKNLIECSPLSDKDVQDDTSGGLMDEAVFFSYELLIKGENLNEVKYQHKSILNGVDRLGAFTETCFNVREGCRVVSCPLYYTQDGDRCTFSGDIFQLNVSLSSGPLSWRHYSNSKLNSLRVLPFKSDILNYMFEDIPILGQPMIDLNSGCSEQPTETRTQENYGYCDYFVTLNVKVPKSFNIKQQIIMIGFHVNQLQRSMKVIASQEFILHHFAQRKIEPPNETILNLNPGTDIKESDDAKNGSVHVFHQTNKTQRETATSSCRNAGGMFGIIFGTLLCFLIASNVH
ncbi:unnamed protein product [Owenia fusiformis]|uniref:Uncharacterized protein n=1 Tax=Owenia fusiformis TaxID=6347 RepID=A0A8J1UKX1_OWEFU|nr:unnamed protein product [Owenia fusiformis]